MDDLQLNNNDESQSFKRNLRFQRMQSRSPKKDQPMGQGNFQFISKLFKSEDDNESRNANSIIFSESSFYYNQNCSSSGKQEEEKQQQSHYHHHHQQSQSQPQPQSQSSAQSRRSSSKFGENSSMIKINSESQLKVAQIEGQRKSSSCEQMAEVIHFQKQTWSKKKQQLFENLIVTLITTFNPQMTKPQYLCKLNPNFSVFNRILKQDNKDSILIYGVSSTGKSSSIDWALKHNKNYQKLSIDCLQFESQVSFIFKLNEMLKNFFQIKITLDIDYDQFTRKSLFTMLEPFIHKSNKKGVLVVENAEFLVRFTSHKVIYNLSELAANSRKNIKIILITKHPNFINSLDRRQRSRLKLIPIELLKYRQSVINIFQERFNYVQKQVDQGDSHLLCNESKAEKEKLEKLIKVWLEKISSLFCQNQSFKRQLQTLSKGIENHLNAACWVMAKMLHLDKIQQSPQKQLQQEMIHLYKNIMNNSNSLPSKNLLQNANLDQKIFMALVYSMLTNQRKPHSFKTILRISYEFKAQKVQKAFNIYLSEANLKKAYLKLIDKKIIHFQDGENDQSDKQIKVSMNYLDIREAIIGDGQSEPQDLPYFVKQVLCL